MKQISNDFGSDSCPQESKDLPIWKVMPISKCWIGLPKIQYVIWWGNLFWILDNYKDAVKRRVKSGIWPDLLLPD